MVLNDDLVSRFYFLLALFVIRADGRIRLSLFKSWKHAMSILNFSVAFPEFDVVLSEMLAIFAGIFIQMNFLPKNIL